MYFCWLRVVFCPQKLFGIEMAEFKVQIKCMWNSETGEFENFAGEEESMQDEEDDNDDEDDAEWNFSKAGEFLRKFLLSKADGHFI